MASSNRTSRRASEDFTSGATPDVIRSTILSLIPHLKVPEEKKRALILEIQKSDFNQPSVIEYFIGIVGVSQYDSALRAAVGQALVPSMGVVAQASSSTRQVTGKAYCHGGDVAYFCSVDLELETMINNALFGHSSKRKRMDHHRLTNSSIVAKRIGHSDVSDGFVEMVQRALESMCVNITSQCVSQKQAQQEGRKVKLDTAHLLSVIQRMNECMDLPVRVTEKWERKIIDRLVGGSASGFSK